jgi:CheY-like chemotaxis protein
MSVTEPSAIAVAPRGTTPAMAALVERLRAGGMKVTVTDELGSAALLAVQSPEAPPCILLDVEGDEIEDRRRAADVIHRAASAIPHVLPIAVCGRADAQMIVACLRAGAGDVLDIQLEGTANAQAHLARVWQRQREAARTKTLADHMRAMVEDLLKDLIRTERRSLALEDAADKVREPAILIVERDREIADALAERLEAVGITSYAYITGEDAVVARLSGQIDLALVAAQLPGVKQTPDAGHVRHAPIHTPIDGLETIRRLRDQHPGLPAFLLTSVQDGELAADAADLGVVGFVQKPLADLAELVERLAQLARESLGRTREHTYLERIKERHDRVLARYRSLPRES